MVMVLKNQLVLEFMAKQEGNSATLRSPGQKAL